MAPAKNTAGSQIPKKSTIKNTKKTKGNVKKVRPAPLNLPADMIPGAVMAYNAAGWSQKDIAAAVGMSQTGVRKMVIRLQTPPVPKEDQAPSPTSRRIILRRALVRTLHEEQPRANSKDIAWRMRQISVHKVSQRTVIRDQKALGGRHLTCQKVPRITEAQRLKRLAFANRILTTYPDPKDPFWTKIVFSDETKRGTSDMDQTAWVYPGEERPTRTMERWDCKIHLWGYIGFDGLRHFELCEEDTVNQVTYLARLKRTIGKRRWKNKRVWQQDGATAHTALTVRSWLDTSQQSRITEWPPNSPDLSPIENLWGRMWVDAMRLVPKDADELWACCQAVLKSYEKKYYNKLIMSFRKRLQMVVAANGNTIGQNY